jgi:hypothetical protein
VNDTGFIFLLITGAALLVGIVTVAHVSARNLQKRVSRRRAQAAAAEPELDFGDIDVNYSVRARDIIEPMHAGGGGYRY